MEKQKLATESPPPDEAELIEAVVQNMLRAYLGDHPAGGSKPNTRGLHAKAHGCLDIQFEVEPDLPQELRVGLFAEPKTYTGWMRFSNGSQNVNPDKTKDVRAMAIKLRGVPGDKVLEGERNATTHDLILANHNVFFVRNARDYVNFTGAIARKDIVGLLGFLFGWNPLKWRFREMTNLITPMLQKVSNLLGIPFYSQVPYRYGPYAVKYAAFPRVTDFGSLPRNPSPNYLREALVEQLKKSQACFDFMIQLQVDADKMPIEDPTIAWPETLSAWRKLATIRIPVQDFNTPERDQFLENLAFNPWHCLPEHQPMGGVGRVRRAVYLAIAKLRRERNGASQVEPS